MVKTHTKNNLGRITLACIFQHQCSWTCRLSESLNPNHNTNPGPTPTPWLVQIRKRQEQQCQCPARITLACPFLPQCSWSCRVLTLSLLTLSLTLTIALAQSQSQGWCSSQAVGAAMLGPCWDHAGVPIPAPAGVNLCCRPWVPWKCHSLVCKKHVLKKKNKNKPAKL